MLQEEERALFGPGGETALNWLVTGGCGFLGTALIRSLMEEGGHSIRVVDNLTVGDRDDLATAADFVEKSPEDPGPIDGPVELVVGDILDEELALRAAEGADAIVHLAANTGVLPSVEDPRGDRDLGGRATHPRGDGPPPRRPLRREQARRRGLLLGLLPDLRHRHRRFTLRQSLRPPLGPQEQRRRPVHPAGYERGSPGDLRRRLPDPRLHLYRGPDP